MIEEWTLELAGWSHEEIANATPTQQNLDLFFDKTEANNAIQRGLTAYMRRREAAGKGQYSNDKHIVAKKFNETWEILTERFSSLRAPVEAEAPIEPPKPITFSAIKYTTARGNKRLPEGKLATYRFFYEIKPIDVSFGKVERKIIQGKRIVHKEFIEEIDIGPNAPIKGINEVVGNRDRLTKSSMKAVRQFYDLVKQV